MSELYGEIIRQYLQSNGRVVVVGGSRVGKSTLAALLIGQCPVRCGDPERDVTDPLTGVEYVPESYLGQLEERERWSATSQWVRDNWLPLRGPWLCEGVGLPRALRKWRRQEGGTPPCDLVIYVRRKPFVSLKPGQAAQAKGVDKVMKEIRGWLDRNGVPVVEVW